MSDCLLQQSLEFSSIRSALQATSVSVLKEPNAMLLVSHAFISLLSTAWCGVSLPMTDWVGDLGVLGSVSVTCPCSRVCAN